MWHNFGLKNNGYFELCCQVKLIAEGVFMIQNHMIRKIWQFETFLKIRKFYTLWMTQNSNKSFFLFLLEISIVCQNFEMTQNFFESIIPPIQFLFEFWAISEFLN